MINRILILSITIIFTQLLSAQDYVDIIKADYATVFGAGFENNDSADTNVNLLDIAVTYPIVVSEKLAVITGVDYNQHGLDLIPNGEGVTLNNITLKAGVAIKHNEKWSGTYLFLPKIASQELHTDGDQFFFGGLALLKYQKSKRMQYRIGAYASSEGFGVIMTPVIGLYYLNESETWEVTANLPINADINYRFNTAVAVGFGFQAPVRSYSLKREDNIPDLYTQVSSIEAGPYVQHSFLEKSVLVRLQAGYSSVSYEVFQEGDTLPIRLSAIEFGDDRNLLNPEMTGNLFVRVGATYRFHLNKKKD
ncbi:DUF6268 family outer membrane beta-barrel protein [Aquimarina algiphila]|uniref:DUF6268 family outer membrane beta-barrel protein n=1 Tax=Aquimarina algiphila TaxID=2047982 RepID=UPI0023311A4C|nr:DUF6268 family outer membrane beta-barrel protein [Aquimarina algiphila]